MLTAAAALRAQLDDIEKSLAALESQMTSLRTQKERLLTDLDSLKYPVLTLPNEITVEIFFHFVSLMRQVPYRPQPYHGLLKLAGVCRTWRAVTLSTCALWSGEVQVTCSAIRNASKLLETCLPRAGSLPLDLYIKLPPDISSTDMIISTLILYGSQWRRIHLSSPVMCMWRLTSPIDRFPRSLPLLECLTLSNLRADDNSVSSLRHAPHLCELSLHNSSWAIQLGLPFNKLTKLNLSSFSITPLLAVLAYTPKLECLELGYATNDAQVVPLSILLPHLHTFACEEDPSTMVLQYLTLPALEQLVLSDLSGAGVHAVQSCIARSHSTIHTLDIVDLYFNAAYDCLCSLPTIRNLGLSSLPWSLDDKDSFFAAMISGSCLPALESLTCEECWSMKPDQLFEVVSARWRGMEGTAKLNSVSLYFEEEDSSEFANAVDHLYELGRQGLKLKITGAPGATRY
ncbi:hypothetical protein GGX14DRAFT_648118 [Mycena pura]|uniref:F-box domain-containing protein n=1 Tax=Mycena pura TaxID=153505 RepID=A0AAD6Y9K1_9AGAR|nr:hypothetical protein GGX14DRAFT_648118 [Mycena pura]